MPHGRGYGAHEDRVSASLQQEARPKLAAEADCVVTALRANCFEVRAVAESTRRDSRLAFTDRKIVWFERETDSAQVEIQYAFRALCVFRARGGPAGRYFQSLL